MAYKVTDENYYYVSRLVMKFYNEKTIDGNDNMSMKEFFEEFEKWCIKEEMPVLHIHKKFVYMVIRERLPFRKSATINGKTIKNVIIHRSLIQGEQHGRNKIY